MGPASFTFLPMAIEIEAYPMATIQSVYTIAIEVENQRCYITIRRVLKVLLCTIRCQPQLNSFYSSTFQ
ncbi:TPA: hypothetical protein L6A80_26590 [Pseudomonas aeruginosa]|nr:hypothetical protein APA64_17830 [Pseudomonas aeruginosa]RQI48361.1 hypothetical protein IPC17_21540 [Pseudomonas aeruginosa]HBP5548731.1 hypothetical protein [Pseudomonas aeruginosa]HBP6561920.1 hypothetical protein [Pseudomonas aeruginosa]HBP6752440.1 hypothetical protein [Pseudomonas aeruginosa]